MREVCHAPLLEKLRRHAFRRGFVGDMLGSVLTKLCVRPFRIRLGPGATRTIKTTHLIQFQERARTAYRPHLAPGAFHCRNDCGHTASYFTDWRDLDWSRFLRRLSAGLRGVLVLASHYVFTGVPRSAELFYLLTE